MTLRISYPDVSRVARDVEDAAEGLDRWTAVELPSGRPMQLAADDLQHMLGAVITLRQNGLDLAGRLDDFLADVIAVESHVEQGALGEVLHAVGMVPAEDVDR